MSSFHSISDIIQIVQQAANPGKALAIFGYVKTSKTNADGSPEVGDYLVRLLPHEGYNQLLRASLEKLTARQLEKPDWVSPGVWLAQLHAKEEAWRRSLNGERTTRNFSRPLSPVPGVKNGAFYPDEPETLVVQDLERLNFAPPPPEGKSETARVNSYIQNNSPVGRFIKQLNLRVGGFRDLKVVDAPTDLDTRK